MAGNENRPPPGRAAAPGGTGADGKVVLAGDDTQIVCRVLSCSFCSEPPQGRKPPERPPHKRSTTDDELVHHLEVPPLCNARPDPPCSMPREPRPSPSRY